MKRTQDIQEFIDQIKFTYSDHGIGGLVHRSIRYVPNSVLIMLSQPRVLSREELKSQALENGVIWDLDNEEQITLRQPDRDRDDTLFESYPDTHLPDQPFVCEITEGCLVGPNAIVFTEEDQLVKESIRARDFDLDILKERGDRVPHLNVLLLYLESILGINHERSYYSENVVLPLVCPDQSYFHWVVEYLPKIRYLEKYKQITGRDPTVLIEENPRNFVRETLRYTGGDQLKYREWTKDRRRVKRIVVPIHRLQTFNAYTASRSEYNPSRADLEWLRDRIRSSIPQEGQAGSSERIYISRQRASRGRKVRNYEELMEVLHERGFKSYIFEELDFRAQIELVANAEAIVGPHGAGLVNVLFGDDPTIIELFPKHKQAPYFYYISNMFGFDYESIISESEGENITVDTELVATILDKYELN